MVLFTTIVIFLRLLLKFRCSKKKLQPLSFYWPYHTEHFWNQKYLSWVNRIMSLFSINLTMYLERVFEKIREFKCVSTWICICVWKYKKLHSFTYISAKVYRKKEYHIKLEKIHYTFVNKHRLREYFSQSS